MDLFEDRNAYGFPKTTVARELVSKIISKNYSLVISPIVIEELTRFGYFQSELEMFFKPFKKVIFLQHCSRDVLVQMESIAFQRVVPRKDILHALLSRESDSILVTRDKHFSKLLDITIPVTPEELLQSEFSF